MPAAQPPIPTEQRPTGPRPASHLIVLTRHSSNGEGVEWRLAASMVVPNLPTPDQLLVQVPTDAKVELLSTAVAISESASDEGACVAAPPQDLRVVVGSTLANRIAVARVDKSASADWGVAVTGELVRSMAAAVFAHHSLTLHFVCAHCCGPFEPQELPPTHVCRGLFVGARSPFLQVASTEKAKKSGFFHAVVPRGEPQQLHLSKFKLPSAAAARRVRADDSASSSSEAAPGEGALPGRSPENGSTSALLAAIAAKLDALQSHLDARFDSLETQLSHLAERMGRLEVDVHHQD